MTARSSGNPARSERLVIVGGSPEPEQLANAERLMQPLARFIDTSDYVIRMNNVKNHRSPWIGRKTDMQAVSNSGVPGKRYATGKRIEFDHIDPPKEIFWTFTEFYLFWARRINGEDEFHGVDFAEKIVQHQAWRGLKQHRLPIWREAQLGLLLALACRRPFVASSGIRTIWLALNSRRFAHYRKYLVGFGFKGWKGHAFDVEANLARSLARRGKLHFLQESDLEFSEH